jgi:hypothetical protein
MKKRNLLVALFFLAAAGLLLHIRIHNFIVTDKLHPFSYSFDSTLFFALFFPLLDVFVVTALFMSRSTAAYGYLLNGLLVIYGTILMSHYSLAEMTTRSMPVQALLLKSTLPDICIAWGDFFVGKSLYEQYMKEKAVSDRRVSTNSHLPA